MDCEALSLGERRLALADVAAVARERRPVMLAPAVAARLQAARAVIERCAARGEAVYGLTTGLGAAVDTRLPPEDAAEFQRRALMARAVGVGELVSTDVVRAMLVTRLAGVAQGASGLSPALAEAIAAMLNRGVHPRVRRIGSLGEADLSTLAQLFLPFAGGGEAELDGAVLPGPEALRRAGMAAPALGLKDALALINANAYAVGLAALTVTDLALALEAATVAGALSLEGFRANLSVIDPRIVALRPAPGQADGAERLRRLLEGSDLFEPRRARRVQDPLSFRCLTPVHGAAFDALATARAAVEADLNGAGDSPAVLAGDDTMLSTVNFDTTALALAFACLGLAAAHVAALAAFRIGKLMSPSVSDLPRFLTRHGGSRTGFATAQKTAAALEAEIRHLAMPPGAMAAPVADGVEDYAPLAAQTVERTAAIATRLTRLAAVELIVAAEAVDLRESVRLGRGTAQAHAFVRRRVDRLEDDRPMGVEFEGLARDIEAGALRGAVPESARP